MLSLLSFLILGTVFGGVVVVSVLAVRSPDQDPRAASRAEVPARGTSEGILLGLERRLRVELAIAQAYADDPSVDTLWASAPEEHDA